MNEQNLAPIYEQLGDAFAHAKDKVSIIKVDADGKGKGVGQKYGVTGFPSEHLDTPLHHFL
jgi:protein disulfide-isomerase A6